jgi:hypothetical protein
MVKTTYWAVPCRTCGGWIALAPVRFDSQGVRIEHPVHQEDAVVASCMLCRNRAEYATHEINLWEGPAPAGAFESNPAFAERVAVPQSQESEQPRDRRIK